MNQINTLPPDHIGVDSTFSYAAWTPNTRVTLANVPWDNSYRDIVKFPDAFNRTLNQYIDSMSGANLTITQLSYVKPNEPVRIDTPFNVAYQYNYLRASNPIQPIPGNDIQRDYYYFILDVRYISPNTTELVLQLDVWQTFGPYVKFGRCYIERGHIGMANSNQFSNYGRDYLTIPEGLDVGGEYQTIDKANKAVMAYDKDSFGPDGENFNILVCSTTDLLQDGGTQDAPKMNTAQGGSFFGLPSGANYYIFKDYVILQSFFTTLQAQPWITQGVVSITAIPPIKRYLPSFQWSASGIMLAPTFVLTPTWYSMMPNWRSNSYIKEHIGERYSKLKKLWTYPYMAVELTTFTGTPIVLKPEMWHDDNAGVIERIAPVPPSQRVTFSPYKYNTYRTERDAFVPGIAQTGGIPGGDDYGEHMDIATQISNFPSFAIVNNGAISYLAANAHSIAYQYSSADWAQQRAMQGIQTSYDQATGGMRTSNELTDFGIRADKALTHIQSQAAIGKAVVGGVGDVVGGAAGGAGAGGGGGAAIGAAMGIAAAGARAIGAVIDQNAMHDSLNARNTLSTRSNTAQVGQQALVRDTNRDLSTYAAKGDYANTIAGTAAKVQDARLIQPTTAGQVGGEALNILNNTAVISFRIKMIDKAAIRAVGEYFLRYGYSVRQFAMMPTSLQCMSKFTYWQLKETYIQASRMPEGFKQVIRGIFEKGVTVWAAPEYIGVTDTADNDVIGGFAL